MPSYNLCDSFFCRTGQGKYHPTEATIGPWSPLLQHGGPPSSLLTHCLRTFLNPSGDYRITRITIDLLGPIPVKPCEIRVRQIRSGKKIELLQAEYRAEGKTILKAHAWRMNAEEDASPRISQGYIPPELPGPQVQMYFQGVLYFPYAESIEWRFTKSDYDTLGPGAVWAKPKIPLIEGEEIDDAEALVLILDSANGVSAELHSRDWIFVPVDMTVGFYREPIGPWLGMDAKTSIGTHGYGQTTTQTFDKKGGIGHSMHTLFVRSR